MNPKYLADPSKAHPTHLKLMYLAEMDLALTYALRRPVLAHYCATLAAIAAVHMGNPALTAAANEVLAAINIKS